MTARVLRMSSPSMLNLDRAWWAAGLLIAVGGCGGDDFGGTAGNSGSAGSAGSGGTGGIAGNAGAAGTVGTAGAAGAGARAPAAGLEVRAPWTLGTAAPVALETLRRERGGPAVLAERRRAKRSPTCSGAKPTPRGS